MFFHSSGTVLNLRDRTHKIQGLGFLAGVSGTAECDFWISEWRQLISSSDDTGLYTALISHPLLTGRPKYCPF